MAQKIRKGNDLMIFINGKSVAFATSHQLSLSTETETVQSKDSGYDGVEIAKNTTWEITSSNLYIDTEYEELFDKMTGTNKYIKVVWGYAKDTADNKIATGLVKEVTVEGEKQDAPDSLVDSESWEYDNTKTYYEGTALISSLSVSASAGENATYDITLKGSGTLKKYPVKQSGSESGSQTT